MWTVNNALADNFLDLLSQVVTFFLWIFFQTQNFCGIFFENAGKCCFVLNIFYMYGNFMILCDFLSIDMSSGNGAKTSI